MFEGGEVGILYPLARHIAEQQVADHFGVGEQQFVAGIVVHTIEPPCSWVYVVTLSRADGRVKPSPSCPHGLGLGMYGNRVWLKNEAHRVAAVRPVRLLPSAHPMVCATACRRGGFAAVARSHRVR